MTTAIPHHSIVVGVDGSTHADRALRWAAAQARLERRPMIVAAVGTRHEQRLLDAALATAHEVAPDVAVTPVPAEGDAVEVLVDLSRNAHLVVVGSHGRGPVRSALLGSVSRGVAGRTHCPVVVCRPRVSGHGGRGVLVAVEAGAASAPVLDFAFAQASLHQQPLTALHCVWEPAAAAAGRRSTTLVSDDRGAGDDAHRRLAEALAGLAATWPDVEVDQRVAHGFVEDVVGWRTAEWDLVVVGRRPVDDARPHVATAVVERAQGVVAVVPVSTGPGS
ncbi:universal stress protein [Nocardioides sp. J54]|uniref:universal stress protein n=1 Tax=Nocardioides sp. J54 TaxID=935866 RepID=UPI0004ADFBE5|nr:universal stress protein [Nocardioides sp. J54]